MSEHYSKQTVSVSAFCKKCNKYTIHRVDDGRKSACTDCEAKLQLDHAYNEQQRRTEKRQGVLFLGII